MSAIEFTDRGATARGRAATGVLARATVAALRAPAVFHSRPWRWRIADDAAELHLDRDLDLSGSGTDARVSTMSCGTALRLARTALAGGGAIADVVRLPEPDEPNLLARIRLIGFETPRPEAVREQQAMALCRTDWRPLAEVRVPADALDALRGAAESEGAHLRLLRPGDAATLVMAAAERDIADPYAEYAVLYTDGDTPASWLAAGEALVAVLLNATMRRVAASPLTDGVDVPVSRGLLYGLLHGGGHPALALRMGVPAPTVRTSTPALTGRGAP